MLGQRRRRWANIDTTLGECVVLAGFSRQMLTRILSTMVAVYNVWQALIIIPDIYLLLLLF